MKVEIPVPTTQRTQMINVSLEISRVVQEKSWRNGLLTVFVPHTTAAVTINENADPDVQRDMLYEINKVIPFDDGFHHFEGNSAAHIKSSLFGVSEQIIVSEGALQLGTWQGIYFCEFDGPRQRRLWLSFIKE